MCIGNRLLPCRRDLGRFDDGRGCLRIRDGGLRSPGVHTRLLTVRIPNRDAECDHVDSLVTHAINVGARLRPAKLWLQDAAPRCDWPASQSHGKVGFGGCLQRFSLRSITWRDTNGLLGNLEHCQPPLMACVCQSRAVRGGPGEKLASDCTEAFLGLACRIGIVLGRWYNGRSRVCAGCRDSCPHRRRERGLGDRARARLASNGFRGQRMLRSFYSNLRHCTACCQRWR